MTVVRRCRKAYVAAACSAVASYLAAWAATNRDAPPGWLTAVLCILLGVVVGIIVAGTREARPVPDAVQRLRALAEARRASRP